MQKVGSVVLFAGVLLCPIQSSFACLFCHHKSACCAPVASTAGYVYAGAPAAPGGSPFGYPISPFGLGINPQGMGITPFGAWVSPFGYMGVRGDSGTSTDSLNQFGGGASNTSSGGNLNQFTGGGRQGGLHVILHQGDTSDLTRRVADLEGKVDDIKSKVDQILALIKSMPGAPSAPETSTKK
jgi:hypothetical protein